MMEKITGTALDIVTYLMGDGVDKKALYDLELHQEKKKRSLDSNAYFHVLVGKLAQAQTPPISKARCKNMLIADYGQEEYIDGQIVVLKSNLPPEKMCNVEYLHTSCVKIAEENGKEVYFYKVYRGTHTYDTKEMAKLIDGTIQECKNVGIETATPKQIEEMQRLWEQHYLNKKENNK
jgi:hypothetical protein